MGEGDFGKSHALYIKTVHTRRGVKGFHPAADMKYPTLSLTRFYGITYISFKGTSKQALSLYQRRQIINGYVKKNYPAILGSGIYLNDLSHNS